MLREMWVRDLALIREAHLEFSPGLNVLTGETGAGKTVLVEALGLLLGGRGDSGMNRPGAERLELEAAFELRSNDGLRRYLEEEGLECGGEELILRRVLAGDGKGRCYVNDRMCTVGTLARIGEFLVDIHGQHEHQRLLRSSAHLQYLDDYGPPGHQEKLRVYRALHARWHAAREGCLRAGMDEAERLREIDLLRYQVREIEAAGIREGEMEELLRERKRMQNREELFLAVRDAYRRLAGGEDGEGALDLLGEAESLLRTAAALDEDLTARAGGVGEAQGVLSDIAHELHAYLDALAFEPARREGVRLWDADGKSYINCRSSGGVFNLGHCPPVIREALVAGINAGLDLGDHMLLSAGRALLAKKLAQLTPGDIHYTVFGVSGGEAIDLAIKLARGYTGRPGIISALGGYHGHTGFALAAGDESFKKFFGPLAPGFSQVPFGDIEMMEDAITTDTAAVLLETIPATLGFPLPPDDYYPRLRRLCDERGALLILDEVQAGLGRTGRLWAIEEWGVVPDIMVLAKGLAGSYYPMSATCFRKPLIKFFEDNPFIHVSTMGGSELGCAVTLKLLEVIEQPSFLAHVRAMGDRFAAGLARLQEQYSSFLVEVRQKGLMIGLKHAQEKHGFLMTSLMFKHGVIALFANNDKTVLQIMPPLVIEGHEVDEVLAALEKSYSELARF
jgi:acetylornithine/succinyldiaminopimelate/putrescine aminotransferase/energy-coupling factor transporter ATP-binding protein EcfA2